MKTRVVPASELDPKKGLRAKDYIPGAKIDVGVLCRVKDKAWKNYCLRHLYGEPSKQSPQPVTFMGDGKLKGYAMLAYPPYWWKLTELEIES